MPAQPGQGSIRARILLKQLYESVTGQPVPELVKTNRGKPCFAHGSWHLSISHSKQAAFCALSLGPVGLDGEPLSRRIPPRLPRQVLHPGELREFYAAENPDKVFLTLWVLKEAWGKWTGEGLTPHCLKNLRFSLHQTRHPILEGTTLSFETLELGGHILALCAAEPMELFVPALPNLTDSGES